MQEVIQGDCLTIMKTFPDNHFDCVVTDPPYFIGFMSKEFDKPENNIAKSVELWKEVLRISKPGAYLLAAGSPRTYHRLVCAIEDAGWYPVDTIMYLHGQGFPKAKSCLKPAFEPWTLARKPGKKVLPLNIELCRIGTERNCPASHSKNKMTHIYSGRLGKGLKEQLNKNIGRYPANLILDEIAAEMLDEQSGILKSGSGYKHNKTQGGGYDKKFDILENPPFIKGDSRGVSRYFYCSKSSPSERQSSKHPTIKPKKLMTYLIKLVCPQSKEAIVLDPFMGSGTTGICCKEMGINFIGIEKDEEYFKDAKRRINHAQFITEQLELNL